MHSSPKPLAMRREPFATRWQRAALRSGRFCLNLDPTPALLDHWNLPSSAAGLEDFCLRVLDVAGPRSSMIKPQSAYFERFGAEGFRVLERILAVIREHGALALLDAKRGDIGSTNCGYADGLLGEGSAMQADALTVHCYLGFAALAPLIERATATGTGLFPVVLSSNPEGRALQHARFDDGRTVAEALADEITSCNLTKLAGGLGPVGAVVGVTAESAPAIVARLPHSLILTPGLGAQGGTVEDIASRFSTAHGRTIPCAGRSVLAAGPDPERLRRALDEINEATRTALG